MSHQLELHIDRDGIEGIDAKSDKEVCLEWIKSVFASAPTSVDPWNHLQWAALIKKVERCDGEVVELSEREFMMLKLGLIRANFNGQSMKIYVQLLSKVGIELPA